MAPLPTLQAILGIALEATPGTAVAPTAFIPVAQAPKPVDKVKMDEDKGWRGSMGVDYGFVSGVSNTEYSYDSYVFPDTIGWALVGVLGSDTVVGASAPFTHTITLYNGTNGQPATYTLTDWYTANGRQYPNSVFSDVAIKLTGDGLLSYSASAVGNPSVSLAGAKPSASYTAIKPLSGFVGLVSIGGSSVTTATSIDLDFKRKVSPVNVINGVPAPISIFAADLAVSGKMTLVMPDDTQLLNYINNSQPALDINYTTGVSAALVQLKVHLSQAAYTAATIERGKDWVEVAVTFTGVFNSTDVGASGGLSPVKVTLQNAVPAAVYHS